MFMSTIVFAIMISMISVAIAVVFCHHACQRQCDKSDSAKSDDCGSRHGGFLCASRRKLFCKTALSSQISLELLPNVSVGIASSVFVDVHQARSLRYLRKRACLRES
jgi:hypothetical protein